MRTKTLLLTAALGVVSIATAMAQVYSVNAVGYVNATFPAGWSIGNNPLNNQTDNKITTLMAGAPDDTVVYSWSAGWKQETMSFGAWDPGTLVLAPGTGFWVFNATAASFGVTFVGEVMQGSPITPAIEVPVGFSLLGSQVPQEGKLVTDLKFPAPGDDDEVYQWSAGWKQSTFSFGAWDPSEPTIKVAEGFWFNNKNGTKSWSRTFTVN